MANEKKWYVLKSVSGQEHKVKAYIEKEIEYLNLSDFIGEVVVPTENVVQIRNGKKVTKEKVYYPGYMMIEVSLEGEVSHIITSIPGVIGFLSGIKGGDPTPMRQSEVNRMLGKVDELAEAEVNMAIPFIIGETIKVIEGPFNEFTGTIENILEEKRKLEVMVLIFGRKTPLELNFNQVQKIS